MYFFHLVISSFFLSNLKSVYTWLEQQYDLYYVA